MGVGSHEELPGRPGATVGAVRLRVADLDRGRSFYERVIGLRQVGGQNGAIRLGAGAEPLLELEGEPDAPAPPPRSTGLFHLALLVPSREELARAIRRVTDAGWRLIGASDHFVSEAVYLDDPEGNGIEIYRDRPREEWSWSGGELRMGTLPLDLEGVMSAEPATPDPGMPQTTIMGHVHLRVSELRAVERFYADELGFEVTVRGYPGALFVSRDGYHHHLGLNTWAGEGAPPPPEGSRGLRWFELRIPDAAEEGLLADPSGNQVLVRPA